jgi:hypothetical protein
MTGLEQLPTDALLREVTLRHSEYRSDALDEARRILRARSDLLDQAPALPLNDSERRDLEETRPSGLAEFGQILLIVFALALVGTGLAVLIRPYYADPVTGFILLGLGLGLLLGAFRLIRASRTERLRHERLEERFERSRTPDMSNPEVQDRILGWIRGDATTDEYVHWLRIRYLPLSTLRPRLHDPRLPDERL